MNKKILAAAVAGVFAAPAFAQTTNNVVLYGRLNTGIDNASATGAYFDGSIPASTAAQCSAAGGAAGGCETSHDWKNRTRIFDSSSRLGVRGTEDLGNGLRAVFQIESGVNINNGQSVSEANQYNYSAGTLASRPSWVGLEGNWGRVLFGRQDVYWGDGTLNQTGANYVNNDIPWFTNATGRVSAGVARQSNVLSYTTPTVAGTNATFSWSPDANTSGNLTGSSQETAGPGKNTNSRLMAMTLRWAGGPFQAQYDFAYKQQATDFTTFTVGTTLLNAQAKSWANKFLVGWAYQPGAQIALIATEVTNTQVTGTDINGSLTLKQATVGLNWEHTIMGNLQLLGQVGHQFDARGCDGQSVAIAGAPGIVNPTNFTQVCTHSGATALLAGARYNFSKRTAVYFTWNHLKNQQNSFADYGGAAYSVGSTSTGGSLNPGAPGTAATPGASGVGVLSKGVMINIVALGIMHNF